jgi:peroxiredoxin Q/BCP
MRSTPRLLPLALAVGLVPSPAIHAQDAAPAAVELNVGDKAPDFTLEGTDGKTYTLSKDLKGKWLVLAWFPKAYTGG